MALEDDLQRQTDERNRQREAGDTKGGASGNSQGKKGAGAAVYEWFKGLDPTTKGPRAPGIIDQAAVVAPGQIQGPAAPNKTDASWVKTPKTFDGATIANAGQIHGPAGPTAAQIGTMNSNAMRAQQMNLVNQLADRAAGRGDSAAMLQMKQGQQAGLAANFAMANSQRGGYNAGTMRAAMGTNAQMQQKMAQDSAILRLQEQERAMGQLGTMQGQIRGQDQDLAAQQAQLNQQASLAGYQGQLQTGLAQYQGNLQTNIAQGQMDQQSKTKLFDSQQAATLENAHMQQQNNIAYSQLLAQYSKMGLDADSANQAAALKVQELQQQGIIAQNAANQAQYATKTQRAGNTLGALGAVAGAVGTVMASDENLKTDVKPGDEKIRAFLDTVTVNDYKYKDPKHGEGRFVSAMAQDLLKTDLGRTMVVKTPEGLMVDYGKGFGALLAAQATLNKRLAEVEKKKGKK